MIKLISGILFTPSPTFTFIAFKLNFAAAKLSLKAINVKVGDGVNSIPLINLITNSQIQELEEILESFF